MPTYLTPGVYVEEIPAQSKPIEGVGTLYLETSNYSHAAGVIRPAAGSM